MPDTCANLKSQLNTERIHHVLIDDFVCLLPAGHKIGKVRSFVLLLFFFLFIVVKLQINIQKKYLTTSVFMGDFFLKI